MNFNVVYIYTAEVGLDSAGLSEGFYWSWSQMMRFCPSGVSHGGSSFGDGLLYIVQSDRRDDRSVHCSGEFSVLPVNHWGEFRCLVFAGVTSLCVCTSGVDVSVGDFSSQSICCGLCGLCSGELSVTDRN